MSLQEFDLKKRNRKFELPSGAAEIWLEDAGHQVNFCTTFPNGSSVSYWKRCEVDGCLGEAVLSTRLCFLHSDPQTVSSLLSIIPTLGDGAVVSLKGVSVTQDLLDLILSSPIFSANNIQFPIDFTGADIQAHVSFDGYSVNSIYLYGSIIRQYFRFSNCKFLGQLVAMFCFPNSADLSFSNVIFTKDTYISYAHTKDVSLGFSDCDFQNQFTADGIGGDDTSFWMERCSFKRDLQLRGAKPRGLILKECLINGSLDLENTCCSDFSAENLKTFNTHIFGPMQSENNISLNNAMFDANIKLDVKSKVLNLKGARFERGGQIIADSSKIIVDNLVTGDPLFISGKVPDRKPIINSLQGADTGRITFSNVDMSSCIFYGARDLNKITIEPTITFALSPGRYDIKRRCIADEFAWRIKSRNWLSKIWEKTWIRTISGEEDQSISDQVTQLPTLEAPQVAIVYRSLRNSFEGKKDLMNAADFYYGEMEMRRHNLSASVSDRIILTLYWIISGYGLYAARALICLFIAILTGALCLFKFGFTTQSTFMESLIFSFRSAIPGLQPTGELTIIGEWTEIVLSILGPVLAALAALAIRERVKR